MCSSTAAFSSGSWITRFQLSQSRTRTMRRSERLLRDSLQMNKQTSLPRRAHRNRVLADYRLNELREVYLEIFCTTKTSVDNPLLAPSGHGGNFLRSMRATWTITKDIGSRMKRMAQKVFLKRMRTPSGSTTRTTHGSRGVSKE